MERVCKVIREALGIEDLSWSYSIVEEQDDLPGRVGAIFTPSNGWYGILYLYPVFFKYTLHEQIDTLVHEHIHVAMIPQDQATTAVINEYVIERDRGIAERIITLGRETVVSRLEHPLANILWPLIKKVL